MPVDGSNVPSSIMARAARGQRARGLGGLVGTLVAFTLLQGCTATKNLTARSADRSGSRSCYWLLMMTMLPRSVLPVLNCAVPEPGLHCLLLHHHLWHLLHKH